MALAKNHVLTVCRFGQGETACMYVSLGGDGNFTCRKTDPRWKEILEVRSSTGVICAKGDNCEGRSA